MADDLVLASTTDDRNVVEAVAEDRPEGTRAPAPKPESEQIDGSSTVSYEHPRSERTMLLERLVEQREAEGLVDLADDPQTITTTNETAEEVEPEAEPGDDLEDVRRAARQDALEAGRRWAAEQGPPPAQQMAHLFQPFQQRMQELTRGMDPKELQAKLDAIEIKTAAVHALGTLPGGADAVMYLLDHPAEVDALRDSPDDVAVARASFLAARFAPTAPAAAPAPRRSRQSTTSVPAPIAPVGGNVARVKLPLDQMSYPDFVREREKQAKARFRR